MGRGGFGGEGKEWSPGRISQSSSGREGQEAEGPRGEQDAVGEEFLGNLPSGHTHFTQAVSQE